LAEAGNAESQIELWASARQNEDDGEEIEDPENIEDSGNKNRNLMLSVGYFF
jgi:hypothetical protein